MFVIVFNSYFFLFYLFVGSVKEHCYLVLFFYFNFIVSLKTTMTFIFIFIYLFNTFETKETVKRLISKQFLAINLYIFVYSLRLRYDVLIVYCKENYILTNIN